MLFIIAMNQQKREQIFARFQAQTLHPTTELVYHSTFELLIAVILSAQATDKSVNKATEKLFAVANTPEQIFQLGETALKDYLKTINLYPTKAKNIIKTCQALIEQHQSAVPHNRQALEALYGVGRKTANVVLNTAFGEPTIAVDTHIFRVANRTKIACGNSPAAVEKVLLKVVQKQYLHDAHHWLILHGRYTCMARKPLCQSCIIRDLCEYPEKIL
jgi:endonuclease-3